MFVASVIIWTLLHTYIYVWFGNTAAAFILEALLLRDPIIVSSVQFYWFEIKTRLVKFFYLSIYWPRGSTSKYFFNPLWLPWTRTILSHKVSTKMWVREIFLDAKYWLNIDFSKKEYILIEYPSPPWPIGKSVREKMIGKHSHVWRLAFRRKKNLFMEINHLSHYFYIGQFLE